MKKIIIASLTTAVISIIILFNFFSFKNGIKIQEGQIDLSNYNFEQNIKLDGEWEFYWNELLSPGDKSINKTYFTVPGSWNRFQDLGNKGYATYRLKIKTKKDLLLALKLPRILTAYKLYINNRLIAECGKVSKISFESKAKTMPDIVFFNTNIDNEIIIHVSNFVENEAGIMGSVEIGNNKNIVAGRSFKIAWDMILFGIIFIIACYNFVLYLFNKREKYALWFTLFCIIVAVRVLTSGEYILFQFIDKYIGVTFLTSENTLFRITYSVYQLGAIVILQYFYSIFPDEYKIGALRSFQFLDFIGWSIIMIFGPGTPFSIILTFEIFGLFSGLYTMLIIIRAIRNRREGSLSAIIGTIILLGVIINDILLFELMIPIRELIPSGLVAYIIIQAIVLAKKFNKLVEKEVLNAQVVEEEKLGSLLVSIGGIAHNLKTPIMVVSGASDLIMKLSNEYKMSIDNDSVTKEDHHQIADELIQWAEMLKPQFIYMSDIITDLQKQAVIFNKADSNEAFKAESLINNLKVLTRGDNLKINNKVDLNIELKGNLTSLVEIVINLITNSKEAYGNNNGKIEIYINKKESNVIIKVRDYAGGIKEDIRKELFKKAVTTKGINGTGLGLYMSYSTIKSKFKGDMWFETEIGNGTTIFISIPVYN